MGEYECEVSCKKNKPRHNGIIVIKKREKKRERRWRIEQYRGNILSTRIVRLGYTAARMRVELN